MDKATEPVNKVRVRVTVSGEVQGVNFRAECARQARARSVVGWVRNLPDGRVEAAFEGSAPDVEELVRWCHSGPAHASVKDVNVSQESPMEAGAGFEVVR